MPRVSAMNKPGHMTHGDVLADLGFSAEEIRETEIKMTIWRPLRAEIDARGLTQAEIAVLLQMHQPDASLLVRGKLSKFSVMRLVQFAERLGLTVRLIVQPARVARRPGTVRRRSSGSSVKRGGSGPARTRSSTKAAA